MRALYGHVQHYAWGSHTAIPEILGVEPDGKPWAELWLGAHPAAPSPVDEPDGPLTLDQVIDHNSSRLGSGSLDTFGPRLSYLLKILAADQALSLQTHPSRAEAEAGFAREEAAGVPVDAPHRLYVDDWPKPEIMVALVDFHALCGFRHPQVTAELFATLGAADQSDTGLADVVTALRNPDPSSALREAFTTALSLSAEQVTTFVRFAADRATAEGPAGDLARTAVEIAADYPGDPGVIAALLMNRILLRPDDAVFLEADVMHAYLRGAGIELMANSNNVLRGGLTGKHVDVAELSRLVHFEPYDPVIFRGTDAGPGVTHYQVPVPEFTLWRMAAGAEPVTVPATDRGRILLATGEPVTVTAGEEITVTPGRAAWLDAGDEARLSGSGTAWVAAPGA